MPSLPTLRLSLAMCAGSQPVYRPVVLRHYGLCSVPAFTALLLAILFVVGILPCLGLAKLMRT